MNTQERFFSQFAWNQDAVNYTGIEREHFLVHSETSAYAPRSQEFLEKINNPKWTYELSSCQVESRTTPRRETDAIMAELHQNWTQGQNIAQQIGLELTNEEVADFSLPLDVYPIPRYQSIVKALSPERLRAACSVAGTHIHVGMRSMEQAIETRNCLIPHIEKLAQLGDHSNGKRIKLYQEVASRFDAMPYENKQHFFEIAQSQKFENNPRDCWDLVRISVHGTVELRMFGATDDLNEIMMWISTIQNIIRLG